MQLSKQQKELLKDIETRIENLDENTTTYDNMNYIESVLDFVKRELELIDKKNQQQKGVLCIL